MNEVRGLGLITCFWVGGGWAAVGHEDQGCRIHAISFSGWGGAVIEDVAQVGAGLAVDDFPSFHAVAIVFDEADCVGGDRREETGPAGVRIEFGFRAENGL